MEIKILRSGKHVQPVLRGCSFSFVHLVHHELEEVDLAAKLINYCRSKGSFSYGKETAHNSNTQTEPNLWRSMYVLPIFL